MLEIDYSIYNMEKQKQKNIKKYVKTKNGDSITWFPLKLFSQNDFHVIQGSRGISCIDEKQHNFQK